MTDAPDVFYRERGQDSRIPCGNNITRSLHYITASESMRLPQIGSPYFCNKECEAASRDAERRQASLSYTTGARGAGKQDPDRSSL